MYRDVKIMKKFVNLVEIGGYEEEVQIEVLTLLINQKTHPIKKVLLGSLTYYLKLT